MWAYLTIQQLLDKADSLDKTEERNQTKEKALNLALQYSFVTPLTSLVVVKPNETESAVDTTQVKPGSNDMLGYAPIGVAAFGASPGGFGGSAASFSSSSGSSAFSPQYSLLMPMPMPACEFPLQFKIFEMFCKWKVTFYEAYPEIKCIEALTARRIFFDMLAILPCNLIPPLCNETGSRLVCCELSM
ncbi:inter-alpha-trypsin inhibitor heavy chain H3-like [Homalodisca vitripennis]|uniref:inter-alpha-trypsin inhibitor heavy chain H3-like n=1 Tax=Homalodisca vitripennis TaxID=197043 RepID=UPI001EEBDCD2|nr:inter-alpha-trypsin inhibitor heavy chain H3-like [Homalodisca vitripennis]